MRVFACVTHVSEFGRILKKQTGHLFLENFRFPFGAAMFCDAV